MTFTRGNISIELIKQNYQLYLHITNTDTLMKYHSDEIELNGVTDNKSFLLNRLKEFNNGSEKVRVDLKRLKFIIEYNNDFVFTIKLNESEENKHIDRYDILESRFEKLQSQFNVATETFQNELNKRYNEINDLTEKLESITALLSHSSIIQKICTENCRECTYDCSGRCYLCDSCRELLSI